MTEDADRPPPYYTDEEIARIKRDLAAMHEAARIERAKRPVAVHPRILEARRNGAKC